MNIYIEADAITYEKMSGIGHVTAELLKSYDKLMITRTDLRVIAIVPYGTKRLTQQRFPFARVMFRSLPFSQKYINYALTRTSLPIAMDVWFGKGIYIFPNYKTWWVPFSKSVTFVHDVAFRLHPDTVNPKNLLYLNANFSRWIKRADKIASISRASAKEFAEFYPAYANKVEIVYLGVDPSVYYPRRKSEIQQSLDIYNFPRNYFLYVGNIEPRKNLMVLLDAYKIYCDKTSDPAALILIGGDGWRNENITQKIKELQQAGHAVYRPSGYIPDEHLPMLYSGARAVVSVSLHEGFGLTPLEADACGVPVVISDLPVFREVLRQVPAEFVDPMDVHGIAAALGKQTTNKPRIGKRPPVEHTWDKTALNLTAIIDRMN